MSAAAGPLAELVEAACVPLDAAHVSGTLGRAEAILAAHPALAASSIHAAALLGDAAAVRRFLAGTGRSPPRRAARASGTP